MSRQLTKDTAAAPAAAARSCPLHGVTGEHQWDGRGGCWDCQETHFDAREALRVGRDPALYAPCDREVCERRLGRCAGCGSWAELRLGAEGLPAGITTTLAADGLLCGGCSDG